MIISHQHRFIFIKTQKTAGTSIETFFSPLCGADDVFTPFGIAEPGHQPRNHDGFFNHMHASEIKAKLEPEIWRSYYKFCIERNPWDKTLSHYHFFNQRFQQGQLDFADYIENGQFCLNYPQYCDDENQLMVDAVLRYENLNRELQKTCDLLGLAFPGHLSPRAKAQYRNDRRPYQEVFTMEQRDIIAQAFAVEIALHNYTY